ncbi:MAG: M48 family metalloprotease [Planctomycetota bacterium]
MSRSYFLPGRRLPLVAALLVSIACGLASCCLDPVNQSRYFCLGETSDEEEAAIGAEYAPNFIAESGGPYPDTELSSYLEQIVIDEMARKSHRPQLPWTFSVLNTSQINAFALPGGRVFVTRGLLAQLESEAQFAHLMGHEIGHVTHRHALRGQGRQLLFAVLIGTLGYVESAIIDEDSPPLITGIAAGVGLLGMLKFSRDQELESDCRGVDYALLAGYDPREGRKTFELFLRLKEQSGQSAGLIEGLMSTHPLDRDRIDGIDSYIAKAHPEVATRRDLKKSESSWTPQIARLKRDHAVYEEHDKALALIAKARTEKHEATLDEAETLLRKCVTQLPTHATFHVALGALALERNNPAAALPHLDRACTLDTNNFGAFLYRGVAARKRGERPAARADLERANALYPINPLPCYLLGLTAEEDRDSQAARTWYEKTMQLSPADSEVHKHANERLVALTPKT